MIDSQSMTTTYQRMPSIKLLNEIDIPFLEMEPTENEQHTYNDLHRNNKMTASTLDAPELQRSDSTTSGSTNLNFLFKSSSSTRNTSTDNGTGKNPFPTSLGDFPSLDMLEATTREMFSGDNAAANATTTNTAPTDAKDGKVERAHPTTFAQLYSTSLNSSGIVSAVAAVTAAAAVSDVDNRKRGRDNCIGENDDNINNANAHASYLKQPPLFASVDDKLMPVMGMPHLFSSLDFDTMGGNVDTYVPHGQKYNDQDVKGMVPILNNASSNTHNHDLHPTSIMHAAPQTGMIDYYGLAGHQAPTAEFLTFHGKWKEAQQQRKRNNCNVGSSATATSTLTGGHQSRSNSVNSSANSSTSSSSKKNDKKTSVDPKDRVYVTRRDQDVLLGRGGEANNWPGNRSYLDRVLEVQVLYRQLQSNEKTKKTQLAQDIVDWVHTVQGGRFIRREPAPANKGKKGRRHVTQEDRWYIVSNHEARSKSSQALRDDHTPEFRAAKRAKYGC